MPPTQEEIRKRIVPVAEKYRLAAVFLFGSCARGDATEDSDVDLLIDTTGAELQTAWGIGALYADLADAIGAPIDLVTLDVIQQPPKNRWDAEFKTFVMNEKVPLYAVS